MSFPTEKDKIPSLPDNIKIATDNDFIVSRNKITQTITVNKRRFFLQSQVDGHYREGFMDSVDTLKKIAPWIVLGACWVITSGKDESENNAEKESQKKNVSKVDNILKKINFDFEI